KETAVLYPQLAVGSTAAEKGCAQLQVSIVLVTLRGEEGMIHRVGVYADPDGPGLGIIGYSIFPTALVFIGVVLHFEGEARPGKLGEGLTQGEAAADGCA